MCAQCQIAVKTMKKCVLKVNNLPRETRSFFRAPCKRINGRTDAQWKHFYIRAEKGKKGKGEGRKEAVASAAKPMQLSLFVLDLHSAVREILSSRFILRMASRFLGILFPVDERVKDRGWEAAVFMMAG